MTDPFLLLMAGLTHGGRESRDHVRTPITLADRATEVTRSIGCGSMSECAISCGTARTSPFEQAEAVVESSNPLFEECGFGYGACASATQTSD
jgi:hypothetical protein